MSEGCILFVSVFCFLLSSGRDSCFCRVLCLLFLLGFYSVSLSFCRVFCLCYRSEPICFSCSREVARFHEFFGFSPFSYKIEYTQTLFTFERPLEVPGSIGAFGTSGSFSGHRPVSWSCCRECAVNFFGVLSGPQGAYVK